MNLNLENKVAIVTGGGSGLGAAICEVLAEEGVNVVVVDIKEEEKLEEFEVALNRKYGINSAAINGDITQTGDIENVISQVKEKYDSLDILVNNAGIWPQAYVKNMSEEEWRKTIEVNLTGTFLFSKRAVNYFLNNNIQGDIINITSQAAFHGSTSGHAHYAAAKGGVETFTVSLAREVAPKGINVTAVAPGLMRTPLNEEARTERREEYLERIPLGRIADPEEVANSVAFLASDRSDYITGATLDVNGGMLMRI